MRGDRLLLAVLAVLAAGCGGAGLAVPVETYAPAERGDLALSASGRVAAIQRYDVFDPDDDPEPRVEVMRRVGDVRRIGASRPGPVGASGRGAVLSERPDGTFVLGHDPRRR